LTAEFAMVFKG